MIDSIRDVVIALIAALVGTGGGFIMLLRRDKRVAKKEQFDLSDLLRDEFEDIVNSLRKQLAAERKERVEQTRLLRSETQRLERRVNLLNTMIEQEQLVVRDAIRWGTGAHAIARQLDPNAHIPPPTRRLREYAMTFLGGTLPAEGE